MQQSSCETTTHTTLREADGLQQQKTPPGTSHLYYKQEKRLQFARAHQNWTVEDWKNVA